MLFSQLFPLNLFNFLRKATTSETKDMASIASNKDREMFLDGTKVEVCSNEERCKGSWYVATILKSPSFSSKNSKKSNGKAKVQYESLLGDDEDEKPLIENVDASLIRPLPPAQDTTKLQSFEVFDVVDAFDKDGWWKGVVTQVKDFEEQGKMKSKKYVVVLENPHAEIEFDPSSLRFHLQWVSGSWVRPQKQKIMEGLKFTKGMPVEVKLEENSNDDPWFPAVILMEVDFRSFSVEYKSSSSKSEKVTVDSFHIRPPPPVMKVKKFEDLEKVNVFYDSAWRCGGIIYESLTRGRYSVFLEHEKQGKEYREFNHSEIRPHLDFLNGKWVRKSKEPRKIASGQELSGHAINNGGIPKVAAKETIGKKAPCRQRSVSPERMPLFSPPYKKFKREISDDPFSAQACGVKSVPNEKPNQVLEATIGTLTKCSNHNMLCNEASGENENIFRLKNAETNQEGGAAEYFKEEREISPELPVKRKLVLEAGMEKDCAKGYSVGHVDAEHEAKQIESSIVLAGGSRGLTEENSCQLPNKDTLDTAYSQEQLGHAINNGNNPDAAVQCECLSASKGNIEEKNPCPSSGKNSMLQLTTYDAIYSTKRRQRAHKKVKETTLTKGSMRSEVCNQDLTAEYESPFKETKQETGVEDGIMIYVDMQEKVSNSRVESHLIPATGVFMQESAQEETGDQGDIVISTYSQVEGQVVATAGEECNDTEFGVSDIDIEDRGETEDSGETAKQQNDSAERQVKSITPCRLIDGAVAGELVENEVTTFCKKSPVWKIVESLEVFERMPQTPHFHPLVKCKKIDREPSAIGQMVKFTSLVDMTSELRIDSPLDCIDSCYEALMELKMHGFDVKAIEHRLNNLLSIKDTRVHFHDQSREVQIEMMNCNSEKTKAEADVNAVDNKEKELLSSICDLEKRLNELKKELHEVGEKRALYRSVKQMKESEMTKLQEKSIAISEKISKAEHDFASLATASW